MSERSVAFDRAAEYYDETRGLSPDGVRLTTELLARELRGAAPVLEVGVGTGQVAIPLHDAALAVVGLDLSMPMLVRLVGKTDGQPAFPLVQADATGMPFADDVFGSAYLRWVLHLIPDWRRAVGEIVRVVRPGGVFVAQLGSYGEGPMADIQQRYAELAGIELKPAGLDWADWDTLDEALLALGAAPRDLPTYPSPAPPGQTIESFMRGVEDAKFSWTWKASDDVHRRAAAEVRRFAEERFGPLHDRSPGEFEVRWRAYDLP
jgi:SAM-dependent methyltransferase